MWTGWQIFRLVWMWLMADEWTKYQTATCGPSCLWNVQPGEGFHEKVSVSFKPISNTHSRAHPDRSHTISWSPPQVLIHARSTAWWVFFNQLRVTCTWFTLPLPAVWLMHVQLELIDMQSDMILAEHFKSVSLLDVTFHPWGAMLRRCWFSLDLRTYVNNHSHSLTNRGIDLSETVHFWTRTFCLQLFWGTLIEWCFSWAYFPLLNHHIYSVLSKLCDSQLSLSII